MQIIFLAILFSLSHSAFSACPEPSLESLQQQLQNIRYMVSQNTQTNNRMALAGLDESLDCLKQIRQDIGQGRFSATESTRTSIFGRSSTKRYCTRGELASVEDSAINKAILYCFEAGKSDCSSVLYSGIIANHRDGCSARAIVQGSP